MQQRLLVTSRNALSPASERTTQSSERGNRLSFPKALTRGICLLTMESFSLDLCVWFYEWYHWEKLELGGGGGRAGAGQSLPLLVPRSPASRTFVPLCLPTPTLHCVAPAVRLTKRIRNLSLTFKLCQYLTFLFVSWPLFWRGDHRVPMKVITSRFS